MPKPVSFEEVLEVRDACLCLHARRAARALARRFDEAFRPIGITNGQFSLLASLNRPGSAKSLLIPGPDLDKHPKGHTGKGGQAGAAAPAGSRR